MVLTTKTKIALAGWAYRTMAVGRAMTGRDDHVTARRGGIRWNLDLREGIDFAIYLLGTFERSTARILRKLATPASVVFDIGANIGAHTLGLAQSVGPAGRVFAFEPSDFAFAKLLRNLALNPELQSRIEAHQIFLADQTNAHVPERIYASWPLLPNGPVHPKLRGQASSVSGATVHTLDTFVECQVMSRLDLIKMDVDGHEYAVLQGGRKTLERFRPVLVLEMSPSAQDEQNHGFAGLVAVLREAGYSLEQASNGKHLRLDVAELRALIPDGAGINVVARPATSHMAR